METTLYTGAAFLILLLRAYVITIVWEWFLVPMGLPNMSFGLALGCLFLFNLRKGISLQEVEEEVNSEQRIKLVFINIIHILLGLLGGFIVYSLMT